VKTTSDWASIIKREFRKERVPFVVYVDLEYVLEKTEIEISNLSTGTNYLQASTTQRIQHRVLRIVHMMTHDQCIVFAAIERLIRRRTPKHIVYNLYFRSMFSWQILCEMIDKSLTTPRMYNAMYAKSRSRWCTGNAIIAHRAIQRTRALKM